MKLVVEVFGIGVAWIYLLRMFPVEVVELYLCKILVHLSAVHHGQKMVENLNVAMI